MKKLLIYGLLIAAISLAGCQSITKGVQEQGALNQAILSALLPKSFTGPAQTDLTFKYSEFHLKAAGLAYDATAGAWGWTYLKIDASGHYPIFAGIDLGNGIHVELGTPKP